MSEQQQTFLKLVKQYETLKDQLNTVSGLLGMVMNEIGAGTFLQDPDTKTVYQVVNPAGVFVPYKDVDYIRTKKDTEKQGSLSVKKAEEAGFIF